MKKEKTDKSTSSYPNFILYDMGIQSAFAQMCQNFQKPKNNSQNTSDDWLIIDNETGKIITSPKDYT